MALLELFFTWPLWVQILAALVCVLVTAGVIYLTIVLLYALVYNILEAIGEALEPEAFDADWMDADKWREGY